MKSNYTTEQVNELLDGLTESILSKEYKGKFMQEVTEQFKRDKGLIPTLEVGKWYKFPSGGLIFITGDFKESCKTVDGYGWSNQGGWYNKPFNVVSDTWTEATTEEVETALKAEATKRGYIEGVTFNNANKRGRKFHGKNTGEISIIHYQCSGLYSGSQWLLFEGKWAKIVETKVLELTMSELEDKYGCKVKIIKE